MIKQLAIGGVVFLAGCATTSSDIQRAEAYCQNNGGVSQVAAKLRSKVRVTCNNTARFTFTSTGQ